MSMRISASATSTTTNQASPNINHREKLILHPTFSIVTFPFCTNIHWFWWFFETRIKKYTQTCKLIVTKNAMESRRLYCKSSHPYHLHIMKLGPVAGWVYWLPRRSRKQSLDWFFIKKIHQTKHLSKLDNGDYLGSQTWCGGANKKYFWINKLTWQLGVKSNQRLSP